MTAVTFPTFPAGHEPSADEFGVLLPISAVKSVDESVTSSTTLQDDDELFVTVQNGATYQLECVVGATGAGSATLGDIAIGWTFPGGTLTHYAIGLTSAVAYGVSTTGQVNSVRFRDTTSPSSSYPFGTPSTNSGMIRIGLLYQCTADGTLKMQWAQRVSTGTATTVKAGSHLVGRRIA